MASQLERRKRLWENFKAHHLKSFYGIWTRFDPYTGEAFDSHKSQRQFWKEDEAGTRVVQKNTHFYEGKDPQVRGPWNFTFDETVLCDGFFHPMSNAVRGYFLQNGDAGWISTTALNGQAFMNELFFCQVGHVRTSVACAYVEGAKLTRVALIREDTQGWPCSLDPNAAEPLTKVPDDWPSAGLQLVGREVIQTVDLELSDGEMVAWKPPEVKAGFHAYSLPNGYMIICPDVLEIGHAFEIIALCYTTLEGVAVRQITSYYDVQGQIVKLTEIIYQ